MAGNSIILSVRIGYALDLSREGGIDMSNEKYYSVTAGGNFGHREAIYKLVENVLVLRDEGDHDNLVGNGIAVDFEGLTVEQAQEKVEAENSVGSGHSYDGCHACTWSISIRLLADDQVPSHLIYNEPSEAFVIREALNLCRQKKSKK